MIILILLLFTNIVFASTGTVVEPELTQEQIDWNNIIELSTNTITAMKLAKQNPAYDYLYDGIIEKQAIFELIKENEEKRKEQNGCCAKHIYRSQIDNRKRKIKLGDVE